MSALSNLPQGRRSFAGRSQRLTPPSFACASTDASSASDEFFKLFSGQVHDNVFELLRCNCGRCFVVCIFTTLLARHRAFRLASRAPALPVQSTRAHKPMFPLSLCELFGVIFCLIGAHRNEFGRSPRQMRLSNLTARAVQSCAAWRGVACPKPFRVTGVHSRLCDGGSNAAP